MIAQKFEYLVPSSLGDAVNLLQKHAGRAKVLAGGHSLIPMMKLRLAAPEVLIDIGRIPELAYIKEDSGKIRIGALTTHHAIETSDVIRKRLSAVADAAGLIGDVQVRNRGTIGGNVCVSDPTNHFPPLLVALDATFTIRGATGERTVSAGEFFLGVYMTAVGEGELLTKINVPASSGAGDGYAGLTIGAHGTYIVNSAATVSGDAARVAIGCVAASPVRATAMEERLAGGDYSETAVRASADGLGSSLDPPSDVHGSADFRRHLAEISAVRAVLQAAGRRR